MAYFRIIVVAIICCFMTDSDAEDFDYCDPEVCPDEQHVCCNQKGFSESCNRAELIPMAKYKSLILNLENDFRQLVASGQLKGYESASRMGAVSWCPQFAKMATCNCKRCRFEHDGCHNTPKHRLAGQNIYICMNEHRCRDPADVIRAAFHAWFAQSKLCNMNRIKTGQTSGVGHFTQCCHDKVTLIGCGMVRFWDQNMCKCYFVCNFNETNMRREAVYEAGSPAVHCQKGHHPKYWALCNHGEIYDDIITNGATHIRLHWKSFNK